MGLKSNIKLIKAIKSNKVVDYEYTYNDYCFLFNLYSHASKIEKTTELVSFVAKMVGTSMYPEKYANFMKEHKNEKNTEVIDFLNKKIESLEY